MKRLDDHSDGRLSFAVNLLPRASRTEIVGWSETGALKIRVTAPPVEDAANQQLLSLLSKALGVQKREVAITSGAHSRTKRVVVPNGCKNRLLSFEDIC
jgi:uncharacterized protein (TIGR00251 family)